jgi:hypothetical protein
MRSQRWCFINSGAAQSVYQAGGGESMLFPKRCESKGCCRWEKERASGTDTPLAPVVPVRFGNINGISPSEKISIKFAKGIRLSVGRRATVRPSNCRMQVGLRFARLGVIIALGLDVSDLCERRATSNAMRASSPDWRVWFAAWLFTLKLYTVIAVLGLIIWHAALPEDHSSGFAGLRDSAWEHAVSDFSFIADYVRSGYFIVGLILLFGGLFQMVKCTEKSALWSICFGLAAIIVGISLSSWSNGMRFEYIRQMVW